MSVEDPLQRLRFLDRAEERHSSQIHKYKSQPNCVHGPSNVPCNAQQSFLDFGLPKSRSHEMSKCIKQKYYSLVESHSSVESPNPLLNQNPNHECIDSSPGPLESCTASEFCCEPLQNSRLLRHNPNRWRRRIVSNSHDTELSSDASNSAMMNASTECAQVAHASLDASLLGTSLVNDVCDTCSNDSSSNDVELLTHCRNSYADTCPGRSFFNEANSASFVTRSESFSAIKKSLAAATVNSATSTEEAGEDIAHVSPSDETLSFYPADKRFSCYSHRLESKSDRDGLFSVPKINQSGFYELVYPENPKYNPESSSAKAFSSVRHNNYSVGDEITGENSTCVWGLMLLFLSVTWSEVLRRVLSYCSNKTAPHRTGYTKNASRRYHQFGLLSHFSIVSCLFLLSATMIAAGMFITPF